MWRVAAVSGRHWIQWALASCGAAILFALWPTLATGFVSDDALRSLREGLSAEQGWSRVDYLNELNRELVATNRFTPLHFALYTTTWFTDVGAHRAVSLLLVLAALFITCRLVFKVTGSAELAICLGAMAPAVLQVRAYHDPILAFGGFIPGVVLLHVGSLLAQEHALRRHRRWLFALSAALLLGALWSYEVSFFLVPLHLLLARRHRDANWRWVLASVGIPLAISVISFIAVRLGGAGGYTGTRFGELTRVPATFATQIFGVFPFSYTRAAPAAVRNAVPSALDVAVFLVCFNAVLWRAPRETTKRRSLVDVGLILFVAPAIPIAISSKYQDELKLGLAYLPVFISALGLMILGAELVVLARRRTVTTALAVFILTTVSAFVRAENVVTTQRVAAGFAEPRALELRALERGVLAGVNDVSGVVVERAPSLEELQPGWSWYWWEQPAFFRMHAALRPRWTVFDGVVRDANRGEFPATPQWWSEHAAERTLFFRCADGAVIAGDVSRDGDGFKLTRPATRYREDHDGTWHLDTIGEVGTHTSALSAPHR